jgi:flavorubredoxin
METSQTSVSLVERKTYAVDIPHPITPDIWWVGCLDEASGQSQNPYLLIDDDEAILINPGSGAPRYHHFICDKVASVMPPEQISHIVVHHNDPQRCAALPQAEKYAGRAVRIYAPTAVVDSVRHYGCVGPIIPLDHGDSIILKSGRLIDFYATPDLPTIGSGFLYDNRTKTIFSGNLFGFVPGDWNLFAPPMSWQSLIPPVSGAAGSKKALLCALNQIERLAPERICPQQGPIIDDDIDRYIEAIRRLETDI